ncbi:hypothetical protein W823_24005 [Williamsia sp. D3]|nr:hypothetical protein W823_24005 [Williamsia sp. D3]
MSAPMVGIRVRPETAIVSVQEMLTTECPGREISNTKAL